MTFHLLPDELIVQTLQHAHHTSLLAAQLTCRRLHAVIAASVALQYTIELAATGMRDDSGASGQFSSSEKLDKLRVYDAAWRSMVWTESHPPIPALSNGSFSPRRERVSADVVATKFGSLGRTLYISRMPSLLREIDYQAWELSFDFTVIDFNIDASQDLLVLTGRMDDRKWILRIVSLSTGHHHPLAPSVGLFEPHSDPPVIGTLNICKDVIGLVLGSTTGRLALWNWKTGAFRLVLPEDFEFRTSVPSFCFLDDTHIALLTSPETFPLAANEAQMHVYNIRDILCDPPAHSGEPALELFPDCIFVLPTFVPSTVLMGVNFLQNYAPHWSPTSQHQGPFCTDTANGRLCAISISAAVIGAYERWELSVPSQTLLSYLRPSHTGAAASRTLQWNEWGPQKAHLTCRYLPTTRVFAFGMKVVRCFEMMGSFYVSITDFHPQRIARASASGLSESRHDLTVVEGRLLGIAHATNVSCHVAQAEIPSGWPGQPSLVWLCEDTLAIHLAEEAPGGSGQWKLETRILSLSPPQDH